MKRRILFLTVIFIFVLGLLWTPAWSESPTPTRVEALAGNIGLAMVHMMDQSSTLKYPTRFEVLKSPDLAVGKLIAGETDIAGLPISTAAVMYNKGVGIQVAAIIGWGLMYVVSNDKTVQRWKDLKGKEIYVSAKGAISDILLRYLISKNGLDPEKDVRIQYISSAVEIAQLTAAGKITLAALPEPWVTEVLQKNNHLQVVLDFQKEWQRVEKQETTYPQTCIVVRKQYAKEHPEAFQSFLKELAASIAWTNRNPRQTGILAEKYVQIAALSAEKGLQRTHLEYDEAYRYRSVIDSFLERLVGFAPESVGGKVPDEGFFYQP
ncbi:MAG TPA: ABC transporter substrate-binding protein [Firmicutes bacterium]|jgi:NitT/TauT family transport system substrate-binding protein|nr:ABC transporter substrate-binding protein [Bacillota bacterium]